MNNNQLVARIEWNLSEGGFGPAAELKVGIAISNEFWFEIKDKGEMRFKLGKEPDGGWDFTHVGTILHRIEKFSQLMGVF